MLAILASAATAGDESSSPDVFAILSDDELALIEPSLNDHNFLNSSSDLYRRHRVLRIDTSALRDAFQQDYTQRSERVETAGVALPLFEDLTISVAVDSWRRGIFGVTSASGRPLGDYGITSRFSAHFSDDGRLDVSITTQDMAVLISFVRDFEYYVILEMDRREGPID